MPCRFLSHGDQTCKNRHTNRKHPCSPLSRTRENALVWRVAMAWNLFSSSMYTFFFVTHCTEPRKTARSGCIAPFVPCALVSHKPALHRSCNTAYWSRYFFILDCAGNCRFLAYTWSLLWNLVMEALFSICVRAIRVLCDMVNHVGRFRHDHAKNS